MNLIPFQKILKTTLDKLALNNTFMFVVIGDLNAKSKNWYPSDRTTYEGNINETITSHFGLHQLIYDPTHILEKSSSCIDLIFTSQPNMAVKSGVHSSLHANCHHQIVFAKFDLKYIILHRTNVKYGTTKRLIPSLLDVQFMNLIGKEPYQI